MTNQDRAVVLMEVIVRITGTYHSQKSIAEITRALDEAEARGRGELLRVLRESRTVENQWAKSEE